MHTSEEVSHCVNKYAITGNAVRGIENLPSNERKTYLPCEVIAKQAIVFEVNPIFDTLPLNTCVVQIF